LLVSWRVRPFQRQLHQACKWPQRGHHSSQTLWWLHFHPAPQRLPGHLQGERDPNKDKRNKDRQKSAAKAAAAKEAAVTLAIVVAIIHHLSNALTNNKHICHSITQLGPSPLASPTVPTPSKVWTTASLTASVTSPAPTALLLLKATTRWPPHTTSVAYVLCAPKTSSPS
jgi:hypothetical protein